MALAVAKAADEKKNRRKAVLAALIAWFSSKDSISATKLPAGLVEMMVSAGYTRAAAVTAGEIATSAPLTGRNRGGSPSPNGTAAGKVAADEPEMRANYLLAAAERLQDGDDSDKAKAAEERYLQQHLEAAKNRMRCAKKLDEAFKEAPVLVWRTVMDDRTTPECAALNGRLFTRKTMPGIPGAMHSRCRCTAEPAGSGPLLDWGTP